jgi:cobalt-zinc-cadmium efflux system membrane fusion protein
VIARATVDNRGGRWVPGQFITGDIVIAEAQVPVAVKPTALQDFEGKTMVFVQNGKGFAARPVQVGKRSRDAVEIAQGLAAGERYAAQNSYLIKADLMKSEADED